MYELFNVPMLYSRGFGNEFDLTNQTFPWWQPWHRQPYTSNSSNFSSIPLVFATDAALEATAMKKQWSNSSALMVSKALACYDLTLALEKSELVIRLTTSDFKSSKGIPLSSKSNRESWLPTVTWLWASSLSNSNCKKRKIYIKHTKSQPG